MNKVVVDSSVILAIINSEIDDDKLENLVKHDSVICSVNYTEILSKLVENTQDKITNKNIDEFDRLLQLTYCKNIHQTDNELNSLVGLLSMYRKKYNLSLGDRYCIALGAKLKLPVYTADRVWVNLKADYDVDIRLIR